jgi:hypothetical protein
MLFFLNLQLRINNISNLFPNLSCALLFYYRFLADDLTSPAYQGFTTKKGIRESFLLSPKVIGTIRFANRKAPSLKYPIESIHHLEHLLLEKYKHSSLC